jgi:predicted metal-dependent peptidase
VVVHRDLRHVARPSLEEVLALHRDRMTTVRTLVDGLTEVSLVAHTEPCLLIVLNEEWHHRQFAERDLDALEKDASRQAN